MKYWGGLASLNLLKCLLFTFYLWQYDPTKVVFFPVESLIFTFILNVHSEIVNLSSANISNFFPIFPLISFFDFVCFYLQIWLCLTDLAPAPVTCSALPLYRVSVGAGVRWRLKTTTPTLILVWWENCSEYLEFNVSYFHWALCWLLFLSFLKGLNCNFLFWLHLPLTVT